MKTQLEHASKDVLDVDNIKHFWLAFGTGILYMALLKNFPQFIYHLVIVGRNPTFDIRKEDIIYQGNKDESGKNIFYQDTRAEVPYPTILSYDGKIWDFLPYEDDDALVWNTGHSPKELYPDVSDIAQMRF